MALGEYEKGCRILAGLIEEQMEYLDWYCSFSKNRFKANAQESYNAIEMAKLLIEELNSGDEACKAMADEYTAELNEKFMVWRKKMS